MSKVTYRNGVPVRFQDHTAAFGDIEFEFPAGNHSPKSEIHEYALERLVELGLMERVEAKKEKEE